MRLKSSLAGVAVVAGLILSVVPSVSTAAPTDAGTIEPVESTRVRWLHSFGDILVTGRRVFISSGPQGASVAVMNLSGTQVGSLENIPGASGLESVDGILYVAAFGASSIYRFDLGTDPPTPLSSFSTAPLPSPLDLVYAGDRLWFTSGCEQYGSRVGRMPLRGAPVRELEPPSLTGWTYCTAIEHGTARPGRIFLHNTGVQPQDLYQYDVAAGHPPTLVSTTDQVWQWGTYNGAPALPLPGGGFATGPAEGIATFGMKDYFGPTFTYTPQGIAIALATATEHGGLLAGAAGGGNAMKVRVWRLGVAEEILTVKFNEAATTGQLFPEGLAFSRDGSRLYAVSGYHRHRVWLSMIDTAATT